MESSERLYGIENAPVTNVTWIPIEKVVTNDYNPNFVATPEMKLLYISIKKDGFTQPIVTIYDDRNDKYVIVDGFHRYLTTKMYKDLYEEYEGKVPCVVINKSIEERMAATVRHNRARGKHTVIGMANIIFRMKEEGMSDAEVCNELGLEADEIVRLKYISGFAKLFENKEYQKAWKTKKMLLLEQGVDSADNKEKNK